MISEIGNGLLRTWANVRGWRSRDRVVVIESDDWGAIRTPGRRGYDALVAAGIRVDRSRYDSLDCLETRDDLEKLCEVLQSHKDSRGQAAKMTFYTVMENPDFDTIRESGFERFQGELFLDTYERLHGEDLRGLWQSAIDEKLIQPQFHAREHLNSGLWLRDLRENFGDTRRAFDLRFFALRGQTSSQYQRNYLAAFWAEDRSDLKRMEAVLSDGLQTFAKVFGHPSVTFVPCNYILPIELEQHLVANGVQSIQCQRGQAVPDVDRRGKLRIRRRHTGQLNRQNQRFIVRNVKFEPYGDSSRDWVGSALREIAQSFYFKRPAVIVSHRINYVSGLSPAHRDNNLEALNRLLTEVCRRWPDVQFLSSDELTAQIRTS